MTMFKKFESGRSDYFDEHFFLEAMNLFIKTNRYPTIIPVENKYIRHIFHSSDPVLITFLKKD